jgi:hypothetical protein
MKLFGSVLLAGFALSIAVVPVALRYPRTILAAMCRAYFHVAPTFLFLGAVTYVIIRVYRAGMSRSRKPVVFSKPPSGRSR